MEKEKQEARMVIDMIKKKRSEVIKSRGNYKNTV